MAWTDKFRPGSFRGVPFKIDSHRWEIGRRTETHEYASRDEPWSEDLGRKTRRWTVEAYVIGPDYFAARDALAAALEVKGPGVLVHPWLGTLTVSLDGPASVEESVTEGGQARFSIPFVEAGVNLAPTIAVDTSATAAISGQATAATAAAALPKGFSVAGMPAFVSAEATGMLGEIKSAVDGAVAGLTPAIGALGALRDMGLALVAQAATLVAAPAALAGEVLGLVGQVRALASNPLAALPGLRALMGFGASLQAVLGVTPARERQRRNQAALIALVRGAAAAEAVQAVSEATFTSYEQAAQIRDTLAADIDTLAIQAADAGDDDSFRALDDLRLALIRDVNNRGGSLARVFRYRPVLSAPALVIAHRIYGDASRDLDLVDRNRIAHPGFVPGGRLLELLAPEAVG